MKPSNQTKVLTALALLFAMTFPTLAAWAYFVGLAEGGVSAVNRRQQAAYVGGKVVQFAFPLVFLVFLGWRSRARVRRQRSYAEYAPVSAPAEQKKWDVDLDGGWRDPRWLRLKRPHFSGLRPALLFGFTVAAVMLAGYFGWLRGSSLLAQTPISLRHKLHQVSVDTPEGYLALAGFMVAAHSLLEEYYWRWFVFGGVRQFLPLAPALVIASLAFMAHHLVVLHVYLPGKFWTAALPLGLGVAIGGGVWAFLYDRSGSLWSPWLSHLIVDAAIFVIGWDMLWPFGQ